MDTLVIGEVERVLRSECASLDPDSVPLPEAPGLYLTLIERLLTAAGWQVEANFSGSAEEIVATVRDCWFAVVGLAAGSTGDLEALRSTIVRVRAESRNPTIGVMVGGPMFTANPSLATEMGADATAPNAPTAVLAAQKLFDLGVRRRGAG